MNLPPSFSTIVFTQPPIHSYALPDVPYRVAIEGRTVHLTSIATGHGTFDAAWRYRNAAWRFA